MPPSAKVASRVFRDDWQEPDTVDTAGTAVAAPPRSSTQAEYRGRLFSRIADIDEQLWDRLGGGAVTRSHAYLRAVEQFGLADCTYYYLLIHDPERASDDDGGIVGCACIYVLDTDFAQLLPPWLERAVRAARRCWPRLLKARITECGVPLASGNGVKMVEGACAERAYRCVEQSMRAFARDVGSRLLVMRDFFARDLEMLAFLHGRGYKCVSNLPFSHMPLRWSDHGEYVSSMRARYRTDLRRRLARAKRGGKCVVQVEDFSRLADQWAAQAAFVYEHASGFKREALTTAYYRALERELGDRVELLAVRDGERYTAHGVVLHDARHTVATFFGRDPGPPAGEWILLMNEVVRRAIERGSDTLVLGLGSYEAKSLIGASFAPQYVFTCCTNRLLNRIIRLVPDLMRRELPRRRVFRDTCGEVK